MCSIWYCSNSSEKSNGCLCRSERWPGYCMSSNPWLMIRHQGINSSPRLGCSSHQSGTFDMSEDLVGFCQCSESGMPLITYAISERHLSVQFKEYPTPFHRQPQPVLTSARSNPQQTRDLGSQKPQQPGPLPIPWYPNPHFDE